MEGASPLSHVFVQLPIFNPCQRGLERCNAPSTPVDLEVISVIQLLASCLPCLSSRCMQHAAASTRHNHCMAPSAKPVRSNGQTWTHMHAVRRGLALHSALEVSGAPAAAPSACLRTVLPGRHAAACLQPAILFRGASCKGRKRCLCVLFMLPSVQAAGHAAVAMMSTGAVSGLLAGGRRKNPEWGRS